ncbi:unnamed protein product [Phaedon cochleariae]|uniref:Phosphodiesterase n=1 Tax=Phaedon cochleariae TaxID=80249 RepID=A0A9P0DRI3_PHACE|nr:unnamed protein product [Phaedon cochleariae]
MQRRKTKLFTNYPVYNTTAAIDTSDKATRRVIAPYVKIVRKSEKAHLEKEQEHQKFNFYIQNKPSVLLHDLTSFLSDSVDLVLLLHETAEVMKSTTKATGVTLYMVDSASEEIYQSQRNFTGDRHKVNWKIQKGSIVAAYVAFKREYLMVDDILGDERFPAGVGYHGDMIKSVLCVPVVTPDGDCYAVIELYREVTQPPFNKDDLKISIVVTGWMGAAIHQNHLRLTLQKQQELNDYLLDLTKCYFAETVAIEKMITEIVKFAKSTLGAERGTFFIIDEESDDLVAEVFEEGIGVDDTMHRKNVKVRLSKDRSIAGLVARTGATVNIRDAYNDPRFFTEVDEKTGFITRSILCMPIVSVDNMLGVVQVVNKINGVCFTPSDENLFKTFSVYCALALHYTRLHQKMYKTDKTNVCNLKLLGLQLKPCIHDMEYFIETPEVTEPYNFKEFRWYVTPEEVPQMPQLVLLMVTEVIGASEFDIKSMMQFILTVRKCYRGNPYHNFEHAFNVAHCMFNILRRNMKKFNQIEIKSLLIAALCHDLDHGGFTNNFLQLTDDTLAQLYDESPLENHHYRVAMTILSDCPIYPQISRKVYDQISKEMKEAILATDLAAYFKFRVKLIQLINEKLLDFANNRHRTLVKAIMMTSCDLSGNCKPFLVAKNICDNVYKEFYNQGDLEKKMGLVPLSLMDREKSQMVPEDQVQFLSVIVLPCVELLKNIFPNTGELHTECLLLRDTWKEIIALKGQKSWRQDDSVVDQNECI